MGSDLTPHLLTNLPKRDKRRGKCPEDDHSRESHERCSPTNECPVLEKADLPPTSQKWRK